MRRSRLAVAACFSGIVACACSDAEPTPGQAIVVVTTDLAVPVDIDSLFWRVSVDGREIDGGPFPLAVTSQLPATLSIISGPETTGDTLVELWGYKGMQQRVHREAEFRVPREGVRLIGMPLEWLCSDANPSSQCGAGLTCQAGACGDRHSVSSLLQLPVPGPCFDTLRCFDGALLAEVPEASPEGDCRLAVPRTSDGANLNVALVVDTARLGNYGFCEPLGRCLVPLDRDAAGGWQLQQGSVLLPASVCGELRGAIEHIALSASCPAKSRDMATCEASDTCATFDGDLCPAEWPQGHSCSGTVTPFTVDPALVACREADVETPVAGTLYCCNAG